MAKDYNSYAFKNKAVDNIQSRTNTANDPDDKPSRSEKLKARGQKNIGKGNLDKGMRQKARATNIDKKTKGKVKQPSSITKRNLIRDVVLFE